MLEKVSGAAASEGHYIYSSGSFTVGSWADGLVSKPVLDTTQSRFMDLPDEAVTNLRPCRQVLEVRPSDCGTRFYTVKAKDGRLLKDPYRDTGAGHRHDCPSCSSQEATCEAVGCYHRLMALPWNHLVCPTLTTPDGWGTGDLKEDKRALMDLGRRYMAIVHPDMKAYQMHYQHWHSETPHSGFHHHLHITAIAAHYELKADSLQVRVLPYYQEKAILGWCRAVWRMLLEYGDEVDLQYQYISRKTRVKKDGKTRGGSGSIMHWLRYAYRAYVQDVERYFHDHENESWTDEGKAWFEKHQEDCGRRVSACGVLSNSTRGLYVDLKVVHERIREHHAVSHARYDPESKNKFSPAESDELPELRYRMAGKWRVPAEMPQTFEGPIKVSELVVRYHVEYWDVPHLMRAWVVYREPPEPCTKMRVEFLND